MKLKSDAKFEKKVTLGSKNDMRNLVNFDASSGKSENWHFDVLLLSKIYYVLSKKSTEELCVITLKNKAKFEKELICTLKNNMRNWVNFNSTLEILKICTLMGSFWAKYIMFELKKITEELCVMTLFKEKLTVGSKNDIRNLINFHASNRKSENVHFDGLVFSKAKKF